MLSGLLFLIVTTFQSSEASRFSTIKPTSLVVYSQASTASPVVKTLSQGDRVIVELEILSGQAWCRIREPDHAKSSGYVLCAQLDRPARDAQSGWTSQPPATAGNAPKPAPPTVTKIPSAGEALDPDFWAARLGFSDEQRQATASLTQSSGLGACRDRMEKMFRARGVHDSYSFLTELSKLGKSYSGMLDLAALGAELDRCGACYLSFWKSFRNLLNASQKTQAEKDPWYVLVLAQIYSDPGQEFGTYVLSRMKGR